MKIQKGNEQEHMIQINNTMPEVAWQFICPLPLINLLSANFLAHQQQQQHNNTRAIHFLFT